MIYPVGQSDNFVVRDEEKKQTTTGIRKQCASRVYHLVECALIRTVVAHSSFGHN